MKSYSNQLITNSAVKPWRSRTKVQPIGLKGVGHLQHQNQDKVVTVLTNAGFFPITNSTKENSS